MNYSPNVAMATFPAAIPMLENAIGREGSANVAA
jgi:hypothetical protein